MLFLLIILQIKKKKMRVSIVGASYPWNEKVEMQMRIRIKNHYLPPQTGHGERNSTSAETPARAGQSPQCLDSKRDRGTAQGRAPRQLQSAPRGRCPEHPFADMHNHSG